MPWRLGVPGGTALIEIKFSAPIVHGPDGPLTGKWRLSGAFLEGYSLETLPI
jgi:hypothetical protein